MAGLPRDAFVEDAKLRDYLLDLDHKDGGPKAVVFIGHGFHPDRPGELRQALLQVGLSGECAPISVATGIKYVVEGACLTPDGRVLNLLTVWHPSELGDPPRLVTAYPRKP